MRARSRRRAHTKSKIARARRGPRNTRMLYTIMGRLCVARDADARRSPDSWCVRLICAGQCDFLPTPQGHLSQRGAAQNETTTLGEGLKYRRPDHTSHDSRHTQTPCRAMPVWPCPPLPELPRVEVHEVEARQQRVHGLLREGLRRTDGHHAALETQHAPDAAQGRNQALEDNLWQGEQA